MKIMKLHLFQSVPYLCAAGNWSYQHPAQSLSHFKSLCVTSGAAWYTPELLFCISSKTPGTQQDAFLFGTGPADEQYKTPPNGFSIHTLKSGDYLFTQFSGNSPEEISNAVSSSQDALSKKGWKPEGSTWYLRGIQKDEACSLQILIPVSS